MLSSTRFWFLSNFGKQNGSIDSNKAAEYFGVSARTVRHWWQVGCPPWIDRMAELSSRAIPDSKDWDGFRFDKTGRLLTPYKNLTFSAGELLMIFYDRQFNRFDRVEKEKLTEQVESLRSDDEAAAIREELDVIISTLSKLKQSPIVAPKKAFAASVKRTAKRSK